MLARQRGLQHISQDIQEREERAAQARKAAMKQGAPAKHRQTPQEKEAFLGKLAKYNAVRALHKCAPLGGWMEICWRARSWLAAPMLRMFWVSGCCTLGVAGGDVHAQERPFQGLDGRT